MKKFRGTFPFLEAWLNIVGNILNEFPPNANQALSPRGPYKKLSNVEMAFTFADFALENEKADQGVALAEMVRKEAELHINKMKNVCPEMNVDTQAQRALRDRLRTKKSADLDVFITFGLITKETRRGINNIDEVHYSLSERGKSVWQDLK